MMLALENSSPVCSLALADGGAKIIAQTDVHTDARYSETLLPSLHEWLASQDVAPNQLDALVYGRGPGSFTGIRIAAAMMQAIALTNNIKPAAVSSLAALAASAPPASKVLTVLEAGLGEIYFAAFSRTANNIEILHAEAALKPEVAAAWLASRTEDWLILGSGGPALAAVWQDATAHEQDYDRNPKAWHLPDLCLNSDSFTDSGDEQVPYLQAERPWRRE